MATDQAKTELGFKTDRKTPPEGVYSSGWRVMVVPAWDGWIGFPPSDIEGDPATDEPLFN